MKRLIILFFLISLYCQFSYAQDALLLKNPAAGQIISGGDYFTISWESSNVENIKIEYSADGGVSWQTVIDAYPTSASKYSWLVPARPTFKGKLRISDIYNSAIASFSPGLFTISEPRLSIKVDTTVSPVVGNAYRIGWESQTVEKINLYYSVDTGRTYIPIRKSYPALVGMYTWVVPLLKNGALTLKIESIDSAAIADTANTFVISNKPYSVAKYRGGSFDGHSSLSNKVPKLELLFPAGNETLASSSVQTIKWAFDNIEYLRIEFSADSGTTWSTINSSYPAYAGKYDWSVPASLTDKGIIRLSSVEDTTLNSRNSIPFKIPLKSIALVAPADVVYVTQQAIPVSWINNGLDYVSLKYRTGAGAWKSIANSVLANMLTYIWIPPADLKTDSLEFKISASDNSVQDSSKSKLIIRPVSSLSAKFKGGSYDGFSQSSNLKAKVQLQSPAAGLKLNGFAGINVTWTAENVEDIDLYFSSDSGLSWSAIVQKYSGNARKFNWTVPAITTKKGVIKICSSNDSTIFSKSGLFEIMEGFVKLTIDSMGYADVQSMLPIVWSQSGVSKIDISIKSDTANRWSDIIRNYEAAAGSYLYINKVGLSGVHYIKAKSSTNPLITDSVLVNFHTKLNVGTSSKFKGGSYDGHSSRSNVSKILVTKPQAGEILVAGTKYLITWSTVNVADSVKIEYTKDGGVTWQIISVAVDSKLGSFEWTVPGSATGKTGSVSKYGGARVSGVAANECKIRISETGVQDEVVGLSNQTFMISENLQAPASPVITSFTPQAGKKGTTVTITGSGFTGATVVGFGGVSAASFTVVSQTTITAVVDTGATGNVVVTTPSGTGQLAGLTYVPKPVIAAAGPTTFTSGGSVVLTASPGSGYTYQWKKDGVNITGATNASYNATQGGVYTVSISFNAISTVSDEIKVTVNPVPNPSVSSISPVIAISGTSITISGANFTGATEVSFGGVPSSFTVVSATTITAVVDTGATGNVVVTTPSGTGQLAGFTYVPKPVIAAAGPTTFTSGGSVVLTASPGSGYTYQWKNDGVIITGATSFSYTATEGGVYTVSISLNTITTISDGIKVTVNPIPNPTVSSISPVIAISGTSITITGTNFNGATEVSFGGIPASSFTVLSPTTITAVVGTGASGNVLVTTPSGSGSYPGFSYVYSLPVKNFQISVTGESCKNSDNGSVRITAVKELKYTAIITGNKFSQSQPFTNSVEFKDLPAGNYSVCITVEGSSDYKQCYDVVITEPKDLGVYVSVNNSAKTSSVTLLMTGGSSFKVELNGIRYTTSKSELTLPLAEGQNILRVSTDNECQGIVEKSITASNAIKLYPNPFETVLDIDPIQSKSAFIEIRNLGGRIVYTKAFNNINGKITLELQDLEPGIYILKLSLDDSESVYKIIKK